MEYGSLLPLSKRGACFARSSLSDVLPYLCVACQNSPRPHLDHLPIFTVTGKNPPPYVGLVHQHVPYDPAKMQAVAKSGKRARDLIKLTNAEEDWRRGPSVTTLKRVKSSGTSFHSAARKIQS